MAGYAYLTQVADPPTQKALKAIFDGLSALTHRLDALEAAAVLNSSALNANEQRIIHVADPQSASDAAPAGYVRAYVAAQLAAFQGNRGVNGTFLSTDPFTVTVVNGQIQSIE